MLNKLWAKALYLLWGTLGWQIRAKERSIACILDFDYQCAYYYDTARIMDNLCDLTRIKRALIQVRADMAEIVGGLPERYKIALTLKLKKRCYFWKIAQELGCSLRNAIYVYDKSLESIRSALLARGYTDATLAEWFENDRVVTETYSRLKEKEARADVDALMLL